MLVALLMCLFLDMILDWLYLGFTVVCLGYAFDLFCVFSDFEFVGLLVFTVELLPLVAVCGFSVGFAFRVCL